MKPFRFPQDGEPRGCGPGLVSSGVHTVRFGASGLSRWRRLGGGWIYELGRVIKANKRGWESSIQRGDGIGREGRCMGS